MPRIIFLCCCREKYALFTRKRRTASRATHQAYYQRNVPRARALRFAETPLITVHIDNTEWGMIRNFITESNINKYFVEYFDFCLWKT